VDALQCVSGCTFGKGNLIFRDYGKQVYTLYCRVSRQGVRVVYHGHGVPPGLREDLPALTQFVLGAPESALFSLASVSLREPERARIRASVTCDNCYESVMATRVQEVAGLHLCIPCAEERASGRPATRASVPSCGSSAQE
jgi:formylmethanofuran dehydrogenase subunit E